jgi:hypothetical protein
MASPVKMGVFEIVGSPLCVASNDGIKVFDQVRDALEHDYPVELSFKNVQSLTSAFLNAAIGQLYGMFTEQQIKEHVTTADISAEDAVLLTRVEETAKTYFKDRERIQSAEKRFMGDDSE